MSFWRGVKSAFGFGGDSEEDDEEYDSSLPTYAAQPQVIAPHPVPTPVTVTVAEEVAVDAPAPVSDDSGMVAETADAETPAADSPKQLTDTDLPADLFDAVIELFNNAQPEFVRKCLSLEAQRAYILNSISDNLRLRISKAVGPGNPEQLKKRISSLEKEVQNTKALRQENRKLHLSIERQKRALLDRINDLESQVSKHHEEKEKLLTARYSHDEQPAAEPAQAHDEEVITLSEHENIVGEHKNMVEEQKAIIAGRDARISELDKTVDELKEQLSTETSLREQLEIKTRMSDEMINDLRNRAAAERNEYEDTCRQQEQALEQIQQQVAAFEQVKARLENRIIELKEALKEEKRAEREAQITRLNEENASLRHTIENNLYNQANNETRLRNEIKQLKLELEKSAMQTLTSDKSDPSDLSDIPAPSVSPSSRPSKRRGRPRKQKLDDELDNTDWFAGSGHKDDPDFGYHEPPRRPSNDNEAQLSLF